MANTTGKTRFGKRHPGRSSRKMILIVSIVAVVLIALAILLAVLLTGGDKHVKEIPRTAEEARVVGTCGKWEIYYDEFRFVTQLNIDDLKAKYGADAFTTSPDASEHREELRELVLSMVRNNYAVLAIAEEYGIDPHDRALQDALVDQVDEIADELALDVSLQYGRKVDREEAYRIFLKEVGVTDQFYRFTLLADLIINELLYRFRDDIGFITVGGVQYPFFENPKSERTLEDFYRNYLLKDGNMVAVDYLFIRNDPGESPEENRALAEAYRAELAAKPAKDREAHLGYLIGHDTNCAYTGQGPYFLVRGMTVDVLWNGTKHLTSPGELSDVIETDDGYYVAVAVSYRESELALKLSELLTQYQSVLLSEMIGEKRDTLTVVLNEYGNSLDLTDLK